MGALDEHRLQSRAWYSAPIHDFLTADQNAVLGELVRRCEFVVLPSQRDTWIAQIEILRTELVGISGFLFLEFNIPRMGRRVDAVLLIDSVIVLIEFKVGESAFNTAAIDQVWDYALDLKNFHEASHAATIIPVLVATESPLSAPLQLRADADGVYHPVCVNCGGIGAVLNAARQLREGGVTHGADWAQAPYHPTPTIIEAARALYADHSVENISRSDASARNLRVTSRRVESLVDEARAKNRKTICFVTGVPGAGKTLVGLNTATRRRDRNQPTHAVFLSGNGPLVAVLREALTRDEFGRRRLQGERVRKSKIGESVKAFVQNVHHFRDDALSTDNPPFEHVVIFDEAQRAWNLQQTANFMRQKKGRAGFSQSEPEFLISFMDRHADWAVVVCLVGGGQEINRGEAGIDSWLEAINTSFPHWHLYISSRLTDSEYAAGHALERVGRNANAHLDDDLHLSVSMRSFRAENVSAFVKAVLDCEIEQARRTLAQIRNRYPLVMTRDLNVAKCWVREQARGSERFGLVASSKALRLKPHAVDIRVSVDPVHWFLNGKEDTRSSFYLEDAATEFQVQGLELDWACVTWDADLRFTAEGWSYHDFRGKNWCRISKPDNRTYLLNAYRVLLTRARQGMVLFVPEGEPSDPTRSPDYYDPTFDYLSGLGIPVLK
ncbi:MAG: DUF2075 domain-containing protein [Opitutaceae bacterium]|nr:DUF2075 domain-containing protein [Opitutaceae bacterium]